MLNRFLPLPEPVQGQTHQLPSLGKLWRLLHNRPKRRASVGEALSFEGLCPFMETPDERLRAGFTDRFLEGDGWILYRMRTAGEPASITGWNTPAAACDRPVGLPLEIRGRWEVTLALRLLRLLRRLGRPLAPARAIARVLAPAGRAWHAAFKRTELIRWARSRKRIPWTERGLHDIEQKYELVGAERASRTYKKGLGGGDRLTVR